MDTTSTADTTSMRGMRIRYGIYWFGIILGYAGQLPERNPKRVSKIYSEFVLTFILPINTHYLKELNLVFQLNLNKGNTFY